MLRAGLLGTAMLLAAGPDGVVKIDGEHVRQSALRECSVKYPDDFAMQGACRRNYESGAQSIQEIAWRYANNPAMQRALRQCIARFTSGGTTEYSIAGGCARNQENGMLDMMR